MISDLLEGDDAAILAKLAEAGSNLVKVVEETEGKQIAWLQLLLKENANQDLSALSSSVRSMLEYNADVLLRAVISLNDFQANKNHLSDLVHSDGDKLGSFCSQFIPLIAIPNGTWANLGQTDASDVMRLAEGVVVRSVHNLIEKLQKCKQIVKENSMFHRQVKLASTLQGDVLDEEKVKSLLSTPETHAADEEAMQLLSAGSL